MTSPAGHDGGIVAVGYGGSEASQLAVRWAAGYAAATGLDLRVVHAWVWPVFTKNLGPVKGVAGSGLRHSAEAILAEGVELARSAVLEATGAHPAPNPRPRPRKHQPRKQHPGKQPTLRRPASSVPCQSRGQDTPAPPSTASWRPGSPHPCCATPPGTPGCW